MHDEVVAFWEREYEAQSPTAVTDNGEGVIVASVCPQCAGDTKWLVARTRPGPSRSSGTTNQAPSGVEVATAVLPADTYVVCACGYPHDKRPEHSNDTGCGAYWPVAES